MPSLTQKAFSGLAVTNGRASAVFACCFEAERLVAVRLLLAAFGELDLAADFFLVAVGFFAAVFRLLRPVELDVFFEVVFFVGILIKNCVPGQEH